MATTAVVPVSVPASPKTCAPSSAQAHAASLPVPGATVPLPDLSCDVTTLCVDLPAPPPIAISILHEALLEVYNARFALSRIRVYVGAGRGVGDDMDDETPATATK